MPNTRLFLIIALSLVLLLMWIEWERDYGPQAQRAAQQAQQAADAADPDRARPHPDDLPSAPPERRLDDTLPELGLADAPAGTAAQAEQVRVRTDVLDLVFDSLGAQLIEARLLAFPVSPREPDDPVVLLQRRPGAQFIAQTGLVARGGAEAPNHQTAFEIEGNQFELAADQHRLEVPFIWRRDDGIEVRTVYLLERGSYVIGVRHEIRNDSGQVFEVSPYRQLQRTRPPRPGAFSFTNPELYSFAGGALYSEETKFKRIQFDDFAARPYRASHQGGWIAMLQHYFFAAWIPDLDEHSEFSTTAVATPGMPTRYLIRSMGPMQSVPAGGTLTLESRLYVGPKLQREIGKIAPGLHLTVDYGMFTILSRPLFLLLAWIYDWVGNWGLAIILVTVLIKLAFFKLTEAQFRSMARMRKIAPRLQHLKERYGDDRQKLNQAMMELYKKEKINPLGGCLPILIQIPVFIALYWVLLESVELRQAPFVLWIQDLSAPDPYFVLPIINGIAMYLTQKLTPMPGVDPVQQRIFQTMPLIFAVLFAFFPSGLVLYWTINGVLSLAQQYIIMRRIEAGR